MMNFYEFLGKETSIQQEKENKMLNKIIDILSTLIVEPPGTRFNVKVDSIQSVNKLQKLFNKVIEEQQYPITATSLVNSSAILLVHNKTTHTPEILEVTNLGKDL